MLTFRLLYYYPLCIFVTNKRIPLSLIAATVCQTECRIIHNVMQTIHSSVYIDIANGRGIIRAGELSWMNMSGWMMSLYTPLTCVSLGDGAVDFATYKYSQSFSVVLCPRERCPFYTSDSAIGEQRPDVSVYTTIFDVLPQIVLSFDSYSLCDDYKINFERAAISGEL